MLKVRSLFHATKARSMTFSKLLRTTAFTAAISLVQTIAIAAPGYTTSALEVEHRNVPLDLHIWYPTKQDKSTTALGKNAVFKGVSVQLDALPSKGKHPLVLLSHGSGGNAVNLGWIAAELAVRGMVVVATNHPGTTSRNSIPKETIKIWERPADLTAIADYAEKNGFGGVEIDNSRIAALGFSLGGHTVLSIAGARVSKQKYISYCDQYSSLLDCKWLAGGGVDFKAIEPTRFEQSNLDKRFKTIVAVDPALAQAYNSESIEAVSIPVGIINLGSADEVPAGINASEIVTKFKNSQMTNVVQSSHFSFLGECTLLGKAIISSTEEEPICTETGNRIRSEIHTELRELIGGYLVEKLINE